MHGRLKVRTSEEERERKKKEQALKVKAYKSTMNKIQVKRQSHEFDDEMLQLTMLILQRNPDITTLWNLRRECVKMKVSELQDNDAAQQAIFDSELGLTEQCLMVNPKSYCSWHHRCWILENNPLADWQREVQICNRYLKLDERNFHTWDYRRYVVAKAGVSKEQELEFCTEKIKMNFSNYSSWHYRSQLLPALYPYVGESLPKRTMCEDKLKEELEMVLTAAFTDPNDSSAWFYQRWLLGYIRTEFDICAFRSEGNEAVLAFTEPLPREIAIKAILYQENGIKQEMDDWHTVNAEKSKSSLAMNTVWHTTLSNLEPLKIEETATNYKLEIIIPDKSIIAISLKTYNNGLYYFKPPLKSFNFGTVVVTELETQLESCNSLLELEPDSKWTLLTSALLMRAIDCSKYHIKSLEYLERLHEVDALRVGYYKDLASKWILEKLLNDWTNSCDIPKKLDLREAQLTSLYYAQYFSIADEVLLPADKTHGKANPQKKLLETFAKLKLKE